jgi:molybdopterin molybdotransferase
LREYVRARLLPGLDRVHMAHKHRVDGSAILTSLTETGGLVELAEGATQVSPGTIVAFLPYRLLF